ncbi:hypothetical protein FQN54_008747 [Arachnomyces sp. PD_36]|nr:hypothetical protein FQN54_008747 [Arachnomyces sp. PD_36]
MSDVQACAALSLAEALLAVISLKERATRDSLLILLPLFVVQYTFLKIYRIFVYPFFFSPLRHLPGPTDNHFFLGQEVKKFKASSPNELYLSWSKQWPDAPLIRYMSAGNTEHIIVNNLEAQREVLQTNCYSFVKPPFFTRLVGEINGKGLLFSEGDEHKIQRKLLNGPFSLPNIKSLLPVFQAEAKNLSDDIGKTLAGESSGVVEVSAPIAKATLRIISVTALGAELGDPNLSSFFHECYNRIFEQSLLGNIITVVNSFVPIRRFLPIEANTRFVRANEDIRVLIRRLVKQRVGEVEARKGGEGGEKKGGVGGKDLLTYMIEQEGSGWSEYDILDHLLTFVSAGHETTAMATTWSAYVLATRPDIQDRLRSEISTLSHQFDYNEIESLPYLNNFCREILRVYNPALTIARQTTQPVTISSTLLPKNTPLTINPQITQSHPGVWGPDALSFNPDRWDTLAPEQKSPYALAAFGNGPRICIGKAFAMLEFKTLVVTVVREWVFQGVDGMRDGAEFMNPSLTLKPKGGLRVLVERVG